MLSVVLKKRQLGLNQSDFCLSIFGRVRNGMNHTVYFMISLELFAGESLNIFCLTAILGGSHR